MTVAWDTPGLIPRLIELHGYKDLTLRDIAEKLSFEFEQEIGRNSVIGRVHRLGLHLRPNVPPPGRKVKVKVKPMKIDAPIVSEVAVILPEQNVLTIYQLRDGVCRWPMGEVEARPPYFYCGEPTPIECSYCPKHHAIAHGPQARVVWT